ncbi:MAG: DUF559 domain-containing protein [Elainella sp.]
MTRFPVILVPTQLQAVQPDTLPKALSQTVPPTGARHRPPRGHAESQFERDLWRYFPGKIHTGLLIQPDETLPPYAPDFAYIDPRLNLHIDIELDEPYSYDSGQPLHYRDCAKDQLRNQRFLDWGWVVIRFSEQQAVQFPERCCKAIASLIATLTQDSSVMVSFRQVATLKPERCWTQTEAEQMAAAQFRNSYLAQPLSLARSLPQARRRKPPSPRRAFTASSLTFYCPECGEGPIRWQGHYIACPNCRYDAFAL